MRHPPQPGWRSDLTELAALVRAELARRLTRERISHLVGEALIMVLLVVIVGIFVWYARDNGFSDSQLSAGEVVLIAIGFAAGAGAWLLRRLRR